MEWLLWLGAFVILEGRALLTKEPGDTLSEHVWRWFSVRGKGARWSIQRVALGGFLFWLLVHMTFGVWPA